MNVARALAAMGMKYEWPEAIASSRIDDFEEMNR